MTDMSERARALEQARETALRTDAAYLSPSGRIVRVQGHKLTGRVIVDSRGRVAVRNVDTDRLSYVHEADLRELAVDPPPSGASPQAETSASEVAYEHMLAQRGLDRETDTICVKCYGSGVRAYGNTATWRGGIGGSTITMDVCDRCWGSGNDTKRWPSHRLSPAPVSPVEPTTCPKCRSNTRAYRLAVADVIDGRMAGMTSCRDEWHSRMPMVSPVEPEPPYRETPAGDRIFRHTCGTPEDDGECMACGQIDCPDREPLHYHHDGCPCCSQKPTVEPEPSKWRYVGDGVFTAAKVEPEPCVWREKLDEQLNPCWFPACCGGKVTSHPPTSFCGHCGAPLKVER